MSIDTIYNFLFHPLANEHSKPVQALAVCTDLALTAFTGGFFAALFLVIQLKDHFVTVEKGPSRESTVATAIINNPSRVADEEKVSRVKMKQAEQLQKFEQWAKNGQWYKIHSDHYDWWMFPISASSKGHGTKYSVYSEEVEALKSDPKFMENYLRGVELVSRAWGWEVKTGTPTPSPDTSNNQKWQNYPIRLTKMCDSLRLFGQDEWLKHMQAFALTLGPEFTNFENYQFRAIGIAKPT